jgi:hypothetical protein
MCDCADVFQSVKLETFFIMLKDLIFDYYYSNMSIDIFIIFDEVCFSMRNYFEMSNTDETFYQNEIIWFSS